MAQQETSHFACPSCGGKKVWKPQLAGKRAKCSCGQVITVPAQAPGQREAVTPSAPAHAPASFEEAFNEASVASAAPPSAVQRGVTFVPPPVLIEREEEDGTVKKVAEVRGRAVRTDTTTIPRRKGLQKEEKKPELPPSLVREYILPGILIAVGVWLCFVDGMYAGENGWKPLPSVMPSVMVNIVASLAFAVGAVFAASALGGVAFQEKVPVVIYKLCAVALAPGAVGSIAMHYLGVGINANMANAFLALALYFALFILLFRLPISDQVTCVMLILIIRTGVAYMTEKMVAAKSMF
jgi:hypothetical protein